MHQIVSRVVHDAVEGGAFRLPPSVVLELLLGFLPRVPSEHDGTFGARWSKMRGYRVRFGCGFRVGFRGARRFLQLTRRGRGADSGMGGSSPRDEPQVHTEDGCDDNKKDNKKATKGD